MSGGRFWKSCLRWRCRTDSFVWRQRCWSHHSERWCQELTRFGQDHWSGWWWLRQWGSLRRLSEARPGEKERKSWKSWKTKQKNKKQNKISLPNLRCRLLRGTTRLLSPHLCCSGPQRCRGDLWSRDQLIIICWLFWLFWRSPYHWCCGRCIQSKLWWGLT